MTVCISITSRMSNQVELLWFLLLELDLTATGKLNLVPCLPGNEGQREHTALANGKLSSFVLLKPKSPLILMDSLDHVYHNIPICTVCPGSCCSCILW